MECNTCPIAIRTPSPFDCHSTTVWWYYHESLPERKPLPSNTLRPQPRPTTFFFSNFNMDDGTDYDVVLTFCNGASLSVGAKDAAVNKHFTCIVCIGTKPHPHRSKRAESIPIQSKLRDEEESNVYRHFGACCRMLCKRVLAGKCILVHCQDGISRSDTLVAAFLIYIRFAQTAESAIAWIRSKRRIADPNDGFRRQLQTWAQQCSRSRSLKREWCLQHAMPDLEGLLLRLPPSIVQWIVMYIY